MGWESYRKAKPELARRESMKINVLRTNESGTLSPRGPPLRCGRLLNGCVLSPAPAAALPLLSTPKASLSAAWDVALDLIEPSLFLEASNFFLRKTFFLPKLPPSPVSSILDDV